MDIHATQRTLVAILPALLTIGSAVRGADTNLSVIVTATRLPAPELTTPFFTEVVDRQELRDDQRSTLPDALSRIPGVLVQKTAPGQGSPYIRGFTGFRTLLLVDGVRLNNSVFREGANQYWSTVDPLMLDRLELVEGPASVLYGSDAIGGAVQAFSAAPTYAAADTTLVSGDALYRYASAQDSHVGRLSAAAADDATAAQVGLSRRIFGDVEAGGDTGKQPHTGYDAWDWDANIRQRLGEDREAVAAWQHTRLDDVWRTHSTIDGIAWHGTRPGSDRERSLDQQRDLLYLQLRDDIPAAVCDAQRASFSWHRQSEDERRIRKDGAGSGQGFDVDTAGVALQMEKSTPLGEWVYGIDLYRDWVASWQESLDAGGAVTGRGIQGPIADDATYDTAALYVADSCPLTERLDLIAGGRATYLRADADRYADPVTGEAAALDRDWSNVSGDLRLVGWLLPDHAWNVYAGLGRSFRAPNLSDLTRFDAARTDELETPSPDVDPEEYLTGEVGSKYATRRLTLQAAVFHTRIDGLIVRYPTGRTINGLREVTKSNASEGYVRGITVQAASPLPGPEALSVRSGFAWMEGEADSFDRDGTPLREPLRTMPMTLDAALRWTRRDRQIWAEAGATCVDKEDRLSAADRADTQRIPPGGTPGYAVFALRAGWTPRPDLELVAAVENLADKDYRVHGSGSNEPGRSFNVSMRYAF